MLQKFSKGELQIGQAYMPIIGDLRYIELVHLHNYCNNDDQYHQNYSSNKSSHSNANNGRKRESSNRGSIGWW